MDTVWLGVKLGVGIAVGIALTRFVWREITGFLLSRQFTKLGCNYQHEGGSEGRPNGWMTRDPNSNDWILWDVDRRRMMRLSDDAPKSEPWKTTSEGLANFLRLAEGYNNWLKKIG